MEYPKRVSRKRTLDALLRTDLESFIAKVFHTVSPGVEYLPNWHIGLLAEYLQAVERGEIPRLVVNMPPRAMKSISVSVAWPAWLLGHRPQARVICASYSARLAVKHSLDAREVLQSEWFRRLYPAAKLAEDQNEKHKFMTTERGFRFATSVGGTLTGEGGDFLIMDDPQNPVAAESRHARGVTKRWFENTFSTRLDNKKKGGMVLVMQRLHADDLSGHLLEKGWQHLNLPALSKQREVHVIGRLCSVREAGIALHPAREDAEELLRIKNEMGSRQFSAQYLQWPLGDEGGLVKARWLKRYVEVPVAQRIVQSWDTAIKDGSQHDASCCLTFLEADGVSYLLDAYTGRLQYPDLLRKSVTMAERFSPQAVLVEDKGSGQQLLQDLKRSTSLPVVGLRPVQDKYTRLAGVSAMIEAGRLLLPEDAPWLASFEHELTAFPSARHDDQVDALTQYLQWIRDRGYMPHAGIRKL